MAILTGINPVAEALRARHPLERILIAKGAGGPRLQEIIELARRASIPVRFEPREALERLAGAGSHQGVVALGAANQYVDLDDIAGDARLLVVLDGVEDPHNLGAIVRTAHAAGAGGIVVPERRAVGPDGRRGQSRGGRAGISAGGARGQHQSGAGIAEEARLLDLRSGRDAAIRITTRWSTTRPRRWCSAARARDCTSWCAGTAMCWCAFRWKARFRR